jgi:hypothetical protein
MLFGETVAVYCANRTQRIYAHVHARVLKRVMQIRNGVHFRRCWRFVQRGQLDSEHELAHCMILIKKGVTDSVTSEALSQRQTSNLKTKCVTVLPAGGGRGRNYD